MCESGADAGGLIREFLALTNINFALGPFRQVYFLFYAKALDNAIEFKNYILVTSHSARGRNIKNWIFQERIEHFTGNKNQFS